MALVLTVPRCPDSAAPETRRLQGGELRIGRDAAKADWVLRDPDQHLSRQHCVVRFDGAQWQVADTSRNGTFLNRDTAPIGQVERPLRDGDRLRLGAYEIEARLEAAAAPFGGMSPFEQEARAPAFFGGSESIAVPDDLFLDLSPAGMAPPPAAQPDHTPSFTDAIRPQQGRTVLSDDWAGEFEFLGNPAPAPAVVRPEFPEIRHDPFAERDDPAPGGPLAMPIPAPAPRQFPVQVGADDAALLAAFMEGAGLADLTPQDPVAAMRNAGAAFRAFVTGLREALMVRAEIKSAMRIDQTFIQARGNNPLKFSAGDDDALTALLGTGRRTEMTPQAAVAGALRDLRHHEQATLPAVQAALRSLLDRLDPAAFRAVGEAGGIALPAQRRARAFDAFEAEYGKLRAGLADDFDTVFGRRFSEAYEAMIADLQRAERGT